MSIKSAASLNPKLTAAVPATRVRLDSSPGALCKLAERCRTSYNAVASLCRCRTSALWVKLDIRRSAFFYLSNTTSACTLWLLQSRSWKSGSLWKFQSLLTRSRMRHPSRSQQCRMARTCPTSYSYRSGGNSTSGLRAWARRWGSCLKNRPALREDVEWQAFPAAGGAAV